jgi:hypothetical protein
MICLGKLTLPLYICPYPIPSPFTGGSFDKYSNDPVIINNLNSNITPGSPISYFSIFAPSPFDYGVTTIPNPQFGGGGASGGSHACLNGEFVCFQSGKNFGTSTGTGYPYNFYGASYYNTGGRESLFASTVITQNYGIYSNFTGAFGNYGLVQNQPFPVPDIIYQTINSNLTYPYCAVTGPGTGYTDAVVISTPQGNNIGPVSQNICYSQVSPAFNFQQSAMYNRKTMMVQNGSSMYKIDWNYYQYLTSYNTPIGLSSGAMFTPSIIQDNATLNSVLSLSNLMSNDEFFTAVLNGTSSFTGMASTVLMLFPDREYYINVQFIPKSTAASSVLANPNYSVQYDRRGWFMMINPVVSNTEIFNTVPLTVDFSFPPLPKNAINPLPCFNNAIEGLIVG